MIQARKLIVTVSRVARGKMADRWNDGSPELASIPLPMTIIWRMMYRSRRLPFQVPAATDVPLPQHMPLRIGIPTSASVPLPQRMFWHERRGPRAIWITWPERIAGHRPNRHIHMVNSEIRNLQRGPFRAKAKAAIAKAKAQHQFAMALNISRGTCHS